MGDVLELKHSLNGYVFGRAVKEADGWRFLPQVSGHKTSTKAYPTADRCLPRWARKLLGCCSFLPKE